MTLNRCTFLTQWGSLATSACCNLVTATPHCSLRHAWNLTNYSDNHIGSEISQTVRLFDNIPPDQTQFSLYSLQKLRGPTSSSCVGLQSSAEDCSCPSGKKKPIMLFLPILGHFWCPVVEAVPQNMSCISGATENIIMGVPQKILRGWSLCEIIE